MLIGAVQLGCSMCAGLALVRRETSSVGILRKCRADAILRRLQPQHGRRTTAAKPPRRRSLPPQVAPSSAPIAAPTPTPREEIEEQPTSLQPKRKRLDYKNGKGLAKDATKPVVTLISESWTQVDVTFTGDTVRTKGTLIPDNEVMVYPEIPDVAHKFAAQLQFVTTFEVMEFLAGQQIKFSQRMAEEHAEM